jgi:phosphotriesterase-related protein
VAPARPASDRARFALRAVGAAHDDVQGVARDPEGGERRGGLLVLFRKAHAAAAKRGRAPRQLRARQHDPRRDALAIQACRLEHAVRQGAGEHDDRVGVARERVGDHEEAPRPPHDDHGSGGEDDDRQEEPPEAHRRAKLRAAPVEGKRGRAWLDATMVPALWSGMRTIRTVTGTCAPEGLGLTLVHEHLMVGWPGWEAEAPLDRATRREHAARCVDQLAELYDLGVRTLIDPCPIDLGRDVVFMSEVAQRSRVQIVCATGLYKEDMGASAYFKFRGQFGDPLAEMTDVFVRELDQGIGDSGVRAGVIKVATGAGRITPYEELVLRAAARAHRTTGAPITTHTDEGTMGPEQLDILVDEGVAPGSVIVGHCCGQSDVSYHLRMLDRGAYLGFDRFGLELLHPDRERLAVLIGLLGIGFERQLVLSHDTVWCWRGRAPTLPPDALPRWQPTYVLRTIVPQLREAGVAESKIQAMLVDNPRRYFAGAGTIAC